MLFYFNMTYEKKIISELLFYFLVICFFSLIYSYLFNFYFRLKFLVLIVYSVFAYICLKPTFKLSFKFLCHKLIDMKYFFFNLLFYSIHFFLFAYAINPDICLNDTDIYLCNECIYILETCIICVYVLLLCS